MSARAALGLLLVAGAAFTLLLCATLPDEVFFSGDGGVKATMVRQFAAGGWHADLRLPAEPWIEALWAEDLHPFAPQFVYELDGRRYIQYPLSFPALTAPFYAALGFRGLLAWPLLGVWASWGAFLLACRRLGLAPASTAFGLAGLAFASSLTAYAAMFWEHSLAVALSFGGFALALPPARGETKLRDVLLAGALLGLSVWIRPESAVFAVAATAVLAWQGARLGALAAMAAAGALPVLAWLAWNQWVFASPLGVHALQSWEPDTLHYPDMPPLLIARRLGASLLGQHPIVAALPVLALLWPARAVPEAPARARAESGAWLAGVLFCGLSVLLLPNDGGKQIGPRYWLHALPLLWWAAALRFEAVRASERPAAGWAAVALLLVLLGAGVWANAVRNGQELVRDYRERTLPALRLVRSARPDVVAVAHQYVAQELEAAFEVAPFVRVRTDQDLERVADAMAAAGRTRMLWLGYAPRRLPALPAGEGRLHFARPEPVGQFFVARGTLVARQEPAK